MKIRDLVSICKNKNNNQINLSLKRKKLKENNISEKDLLNMKLNFEDEKW